MRGNRRRWHPSRPHLVPVQHGHVNDDARAGTNSQRPPLGGQSPGAGFGRCGGRQRYITPRRAHNDGDGGEESQRLIDDARDKGERSRCSRLSRAALERTQRLGPCAVLRGARGAVGQCVMARGH